MTKRIAIKKDKWIERLVENFKENGYENEWIELYFIKHYGIKNKDVIDKAINRLSQKEFRNIIIARDKKCIISGFHENECEAAHIIPYCVCQNYEPSNGILLNACLHKLFDAYAFTIDPISRKIIISPEYENRSISKYQNKVINVPIECKMALKKHYDFFMNKHKNN